MSYYTLEEFKIAHKQPFEKRSKLDTKTIIFHSFHDTASSKLVVYPWSCADWETIFAKFPINSRVFYFEEAPIFSYWEKEDPR